MEKQTIGQIISSNRKKLGLTQKALGDQLNVTDKAVSKWERDIARPDINTVPRLAEILGLPVETLIDIPLNAKAESLPATSLDATEETFKKTAPDTANEEVFDFEQEIYKDNVRRLLLKGLLGFVAGFLFALIMSFSNDQSPDLLLSFGVGLFMAGIPYGWELLGRIIGRWYVIGHIAIMLLVFCFKLVGAIVIGWIAYPISLFYNLIKAQKQGSVAKKVWTAIFTAVIALIAALVIIIICVGAQNGSSSKDSTTDTAHSQTESTAVDASYFTSTQEIYTAICENVIDEALASDQEAKASGKNVLTPSEIKAAYFLNTEDPEIVHREYGHNVEMSNALFIVTSAYVEVPNWYEREEWTVWVFPNFTVGQNNSLAYSEDDVYDDHLTCENLEELYAWICSEYDDMIIAELGLPIIDAQ